MKPRTPVRRKRPRKPRRGRVVNLYYLAFASTEPCLVHGIFCEDRLTLHHVKQGPGASKDDERVIPICEPLHLHDFGKFSIERIGREKWESHWDVDIETEIARLHREFVAQGGKLKGAA